jgi:hypothetical protein
LQSALVTHWAQTSIGVQIGAWAEQSEFFMQPTQAPLPGSQIGRSLWQSALVLQPAWHCPSWQR